MPAEDLAGETRTVAVVETPERIARSLHDTVIRRLFAASWSLHAAASLSGPPAQRDRIKQAIADIDEAIVDVRATIFALEWASVAGSREEVLPFPSARPLDA
jgi:signal transduction histidine kinase